MRAGATQSKFMCANGRAKHTNIMAGQEVTMSATAKAATVTYSLP